MKLTQEQTETHAEMFGDLFETAFSGGIFWSSIIAGGGKLVHGGCTFAKT